MTGFMHGQAMSFFRFVRSSASCVVSPTSSTRSSRVVNGLMIALDQVNSENALNRAMELGDPTGQAAYLMAGWKLQNGDRAEACRLLSLAQRAGWTEAIRLSAQQCRGLN